MSSREDIPVCWRQMRVRCKYPFFIIGCPVGGLKIAGEEVCRLRRWAPNFGKRTLVSRLHNENFEDESNVSSELLARGWTINTKYYTGDVSVCLLKTYTQNSTQVDLAWSCLGASHSL